MLPNGWTYEKKNDHRGRLHSLRTAAKLIVALPVGPPEIVKVLQQIVNEIICLETPLAFMAVRCTI